MLNDIKCCLYKKDNDIILEKFDIEDRVTLDTYQIIDIQKFINLINVYIEINKSLLRFVYINYKDKDDLLYNYLMSNLSLEYR